MPEFPEYFTVTLAEMLNSPNQLEGEFMAWQAQQHTSETTGADE